MIAQILWFFTWPLLIFISYQVVKFFIKQLDKQVDED
jgi:hypothetical protein